MTIAICAILYVVSLVSVWRISAYLCLRFKWLLLIPGVNILYFCYMADRLTVEAYTSKHSFNALTAIVSIVLMVVGFVVSKYIPYDYTIIGGRVLFLSALSALCITVAFSYSCVLAESMSKPVLCLLASIIVPFPVFLLIASFKIPENIEEVIELYYQP